MYNYNSQQNHFNHPQYFDPNNQGYSYQAPSFNRDTMEYSQLPTIYQNNNQPQIRKSYSQNNFNKNNNSSSYHENRPLYNTHNHFDKNNSYSHPRRRTKEIINPDLPIYKQSNNYPAKGFDEMMPMMMIMSMMKNKSKGKIEEEDDDRLVLNLIERQNQQIRQFMDNKGDKRKKAVKSNVLLKKIELLEKKLRDEEYKVKQTQKSPVQDLFFIQNMVQNSNNFIQQFQNEGNNGGNPEQDSTQKFMMMKLMETMGRYNQPKIVPKTPEPEVVVEEEVIEETESSEDDPEITVLKPADDANGDAGGDN